MQSLNRRLTSIRISTDRGWACVILIAGFSLGIGCFLYYYLHQMTLAHYDAKAHLLVARRIFDSLEPGYSQMGVHWLPLIHLIYIPFVIFDCQYRTGLLPSLISVVSFALSGWLVYRISLRITRSRTAGICAAIILLANPNLQYLQSCPLTEPLYMVFLLLALDGFLEWRESVRSFLPWMAALWGALGALCRYEGFLIFAGILLLLALDYGMVYKPRRNIVKAAALFTVVSGVPLILHFGYVFLSMGDSFFKRISQGNPSPDLAYGKPFLALYYHIGELMQMAALIPLLLAGTGLVIFLVQRSEWKSRLPMLLLWMPSIINICALYWGMIYRLRYSVLLIPAVAIFGGLAIASDAAKRHILTFLSIGAMVLPWISWYFILEFEDWRFNPGPGLMILPAAALIVFLTARVRQWYAFGLVALCVLGMHFPVLKVENRPILTETLEHEFIEPERSEIIRYLQKNYDGEKILIDMGTQAPLIYDIGLPVKEFVYNDGPGLFWREAFRNPTTTVGWLISGEGDVVSKRLQVDLEFVAGYSLVVKTEHFSLYRLNR
jgi:hypothetical protein